MGNRSDGWGGLQIGGYVAKRKIHYIEGWEAGVLREGITADDIWRSKYAVFEGWKIGGDEGGC